MKAVIAHGSYGSPEENWIPWLKRELEKRGFIVFTPKFPTPKGQTLSSWDTVFEGIERYIDSKTVLIGHSLGATFLLRYLEKAERPVKALFSVAGFVGLLGNKRFDEINRTFVYADFDWKQIRANADRFIVLHSDNDPYIPMENAEAIANNLGTTVEIIHNAGHFNESAGFKEFPLLLEKILDN